MENMYPVYLLMNSVPQDMFDMKQIQQYCMFQLHRLLVDWICLGTICLLDTVNTDLQL